MTSLGERLLGLCVLAAAWLIWLLATLLLDMRATRQRDCDAAYKQGWSDGYNKCLDQWGDPADVLEGVHKKGK